MTPTEFRTALRHCLTLLFAILLFVAGSVILYANMKGLTMTLLIAIGVSYGIALLLAIPTEMKQVLVVIVPLLPAGLVGGRRHDDPPSGT